MARVVHDMQPNKVNVLYWKIGCDKAPSQPLGVGSSKQM